MRNLLLIVSIPFLSTACSTHAYTPGATGIPFESAAPAPAGSQVRVSAGRLGVPFGAGAVAGSGGVARTLDDGRSVTIDGALLHVEGDVHVASGGAARAGMVWRGSDGAVAGAAYAGLGAGASRVGGWVSPDVGLTLSGTNRWVRPVLGVGAFVSQPLATRTFAVDDGSTTVQRRLPRTAGAHVALGVEVGDARRFVIQAALTVGGVAAAGDDTDSDHGDAAGGVYVGARVPL